MLVLGAARSRRLDESARRYFITLELDWDYGVNTVRDYYSHTLGYSLFRSLHSGAAFMALLASSAVWYDEVPMSGCS
jgi:hypothetical protein